MGLDLRELIDKPGGRISFAYDLDTERVSFPSVISYQRPPRARAISRTGRALTRAGCSRPNAMPLRPLRVEYELRKEIHAGNPLAHRAAGRGDQDIFLLEGMRSTWKRFWNPASSSIWNASSSAPRLCRACAVAARYSTMGR
jgi:hypothetical protein